MEERTNTREEHKAQRNCDTKNTKKTSSSIESPQTALYHTKRVDDLKALLLRDLLTLLVRLIVVGAVLHNAGTKPLDQLNLIKR